MNTVIDGIKINYIDEGSGDVIVLLHGWASNIKLFDSMIHALKDTHRVIALDMPGFGESGELAEPWCVDDYVDYVVKFMKSLGLTKISLLGHSFGGRVIIKMINRYKEDFEYTSVILTDAAGIRPKRTMKQKMKVRMFKIAKKVFSIPLLDKMYPGFVENMRKKNGSADYNNATPVMRNTLVKVVNEDLSHLICGISCPALLIWGENDTATPLSDGEFMEKEIKDSALIVVKGAGHFAFLEQAGYVNSVIKAFLK